MIHNEEHLLPFFLRAYSYADHIILYFDRCTDNSISIAQADPRVEIRQAQTFSEDYLRWLKNNCWKPDREQLDWAIVCDVDELLYLPDPSVLSECKSQGVTLPSIQGFEMVGSDGVPHDDGQQLWDTLTTGVPSKLYSKRVVFDPKHVEPNYSHGAHWCESSGNIVEGGELKLLHYHWLGDDYVLNKWKSRRVSVPIEDSIRNFKRYDWDEDILLSVYDQLACQAQCVV